MAVLSVSLSKNIDKRMEKEYTLIDKVFFDLTVMSTDQEEKKEAIKISGVVMSVKILGTGSFLPEKSDRKSTRLNSSHQPQSRMPSSA